MTRHQLHGTLLMRLIDSLIFFLFFLQQTPEQVLANIRRRDFRRLAHNGLIDPPFPRNIFSQKLLNDPLLSLPHTKSGPATSPMTERLHRRTQEPRQPLGDEEPGFPGISLKLEQRRLKGKWANMRKLYSDSIVEGAKQPTFAEWQKAADDVLYTLPLPPVKKPEQNVIK